MSLLDLLLAQTCRADSTLLSSGYGKTPNAAWPEGQIGTCPNEFPICIEYNQGFLLDIKMVWWKIIVELKLEASMAYAPQLMTEVTECLSLRPGPWIAWCPPDEGHI